MVDERRRPSRPFIPCDIILEPGPKLIIQRTVGHACLPARRLDQLLIGTECHVFHDHSVHEFRAHDKTERARRSIGPPGPRGIPGGRDRSTLSDHGPVFPASPRAFSSALSNVATVAPVLARPASRQSTKSREVCAKHDRAWRTTSGSGVLTVRVSVRGAGPGHSSRARGTRFPGAAPLWKTLFRLTKIMSRGGGPCAL